MEKELQNLVQIGGNKGIGLRKGNENEQQNNNFNILQCGIESPCVEAKS